MIKRILWTVTLFMIMGCWPAMAKEPVKPEALHKKVTKTIATESAAQKKADQWAYDKAGIIDQIRDLKYRNTWLKYREQKNQIYIKEVKKNIKELEYKKAEIGKLRIQLEPYLEQIVDKLAAFVKSDLPFLPQERQKRIDYLRETLNNYNVKLSEKMRRVFAEGLEVEAQYGKMLEAIEDQMLNLNGAKTQVTIFRIGRVEMYYLSFDQKRVGMYNKKTGKWEALPSDMVTNIRNAIEMAKAKRAAEIVQLPLGAL